MQIEHPFRFLTLLGALVMLGGCESVWEPATANHHAKKMGVTADLPEGWTRFTQTEGVALTREGPLLQSIVITRKPYGTDLEHTDRTVTKDMLPHEAAQVIVDAMAADSENKKFEVVQNRPAEVDGRPGFRIDVRYKTEGDPMTQESIYGVLTEESYIIASYKAPERYYHERSMNDFESTIASLKIDDPKVPAPEEKTPDK